MYMIEENSLDEELFFVSSDDEETDNSTTYTTLTTLQPLSSATLERFSSETCSKSCAWAASGVSCELSVSDSAYSSDYDSLTGLEPLHPSFYIDDEGNTIECESSTASSSSSSSYLHSTYLVDEPLSAYGLSHMSGDTAQSLDFFGLRSARSSLDSAISSRGSSPERYEAAGVGNPHCASSTSCPQLALALSTVLTLDEFDEFMSSEVVETRELSELISTELRRCNIPQALFAHRVLGRSQGTLSDLLRNPKPWSKLKTGRETYGKMWLWLLEPDAQRMIPFRNCGYKFDFKEPSGITVLADSEDSDSLCPTRTQQQQIEKKPRILFTDSQRYTLQSVFDRDQRPSKQVVASLADQLDLPLPTVANFFMNARRRSRNKQQLLQQSEDNTASAAAE